MHHDGKATASQLELAAEEAGFFTLETSFPNPSAAPNGVETAGNNAIDFKIGKEHSNRRIWCGNGHESDQ
jgi:hypothetical protein